MIRDDLENAAFTMGCAGAVGAVFFVIGLIMSLFAFGASVGERLMMACMFGGFAFVASLFLFMRDRSRAIDARVRVWRFLLAQSDMTDDDFCREFPGDDPILVSQIRAAVAEFYDVPPDKIRPSCNLTTDLELELLSPEFQSFVVGRVSHRREQRPKSFNSSEETDVIALPPSDAAVTVADFTSEVLRMFQ